MPHQLARPLPPNSFPPPVSRYVADGVSRAGDVAATDLFAPQPCTRAYDAVRYARYVEAFERIVPADLHPHLAGETAESFDANDWFPQAKLTIPDMLEVTLSLHWMSGDEPTFGSWTVTNGPLVKRGTTPDWAVIVASAAGHGW